MILDHIRTRFLGGDLYAEATCTRVYTVCFSKRENHLPVVVACYFYVQTHCSYVATTYVVTKKLIQTFYSLAIQAIKIM